ncbi:MAG: type IX secretion system sortase PorU, partial [Massilibacteroides sp.]|nr:type IX secretion system sortase PorU [Massilibacteroides sp.]
QINNGEYVAAVEATETGKSWVGQKSETIKTNITYTGASSHKNIHLDYITLQVKRELQPYGDVTLFRDINSNLNISRFIIKDATKDMLVFDVTDGENLKQIETSFAENELSFIVSPEQLPKNATVQEFALVQPNGTIPSPEIVGEIKTQNLHALEQADMIIIAPESFTVQAERLAKAHREKDSLSVHVVDPQTIYNEFSSGTPDATAYRRFMKMFYDRSTSETDTPKYLLLFGDGAFDNRQLTTDWKMVNMNNFLLTFQSENSIDAGTSNNIKSFVTDDYFGFLEDREGGNIKEADVDIGIGRFPVRTVTQAKNAVDKVISYMNNAEFGSWKNTVCFLADDGNQADNYTTLHMFQADQLAEQILKNNPEYIAKKLFFDAHKKDNSSSGFATYPTIRTNLIQQLKEGTFLLNYTGHGSKDSWSDEKVLVQSDINQFSYKQLPLWITATCDFTPFDALLTSAGEDVFLNAKSGGIALFTTMRIAYPSSNLSINSTLLKYLFKRTNENYPTLGEVFKQTKRDLGNLDQRLNFILIGDPALRLNYPQSEIRITEINGQPVSDVNVNFSALEKVTIKGMILNPNESKNESFNGEINPTVFDSQTSITTLNNNNTGVTFEFNDFSNKLFIGNEKVTNGEFEFSFTVPKDISYSNKIGKMSFYASDPTTGNEAKGSFLNYTVGGTEGEIEDVEGPQIIALYLNDSTFTEGGQVNKTPLLVVQLWDTTGVNITGSSIGHDITLVIDGQSSQTYNLNAYYKKISDAEGEGIIYFSIPELTSGFHSAELKVWDILNNSTTTTFTFEVIEGLKPKLYELLAAPSPARESVTFYLYHNRPESTVKMSVQVYDMMGRLQWKGETQGSSGIDLPLTIQWNLQNGYGSRLRPGIYIYRAGISADNSKEVTDAKKLIILAQ